MSNPAKQKGTAWESAVVRTLSAFWSRREGLEPRRVAQTGFEDIGDIHGVDPFIIQAKAWKDLASALREGVGGAVLQAARAGRSFGVAVIKRPRGAVGDGYTVMRLQDWARLVLRLRRAEALLQVAGPEVFERHLERCAAEELEVFPR